MIFAGQMAGEISGYIASNSFISLWLFRHYAAFHDVSGFVLYVFPRVLHYSEILFSLLYRLKFFSSTLLWRISLSSTKFFSRTDVNNWQLVVTWFLIKFWRIFFRRAESGSSSSPLITVDDTGNSLVAITINLWKTTTNEPDRLAGEREIPLVINVWVGTSCSGGRYRHSEVDFQPFLSPVHHYAGCIEWRQALGCTYVRIHTLHPRTDFREIFIELDLVGIEESSTICKLFLKRKKLPTFKYV